MKISMEKVLKCYEEKYTKEPVSPSSDDEVSPDLADNSSDDESWDTECPYCSGRFLEDNIEEK